VIVCEEANLKRNIDLEEAQELILSRVSPTAETSVTLFESLGRILSRDVPAGIQLPLFDKSPLDGYALRAESTLDASCSKPAKLAVIEEVPAGTVPKKFVCLGTAVKVMTGAPIPTGADVVIKYEDVLRENDFISICKPLRSGDNIIRAGEDVAKGERVAQSGTRITSPLIGLLAALGIAYIPVFNKVKVAILSTGDELMDPSQVIQPGKIFNSNLHNLVAACQEMNVEPLPLGIVPDQRQQTVDILDQAVQLADIVITTGGVSVGDFDLVPEALAEMGSTILFRQVDMKPGSPAMVAEKNGKLIVCLSGNPAAALVTFELIAAPVLRQMMGLRHFMPERVTGRFKGHFDKASPQRRFLRASLLPEFGNIVELTGEQGNGILKSLLNCNALIDVPAGSGPLWDGQEVSVVLLGAGQRVH